MKSTNGEMRPVRAVIFDCDGVLLDTEKIYTLAINKILEPYGKTLPLALKLRLIGQSSMNVARKVVEEMQLPMPPEEFCKRLFEEAHRRFPGCAMMPGAKEAVAHWHSLDIPMAIATSTVAELFWVKMRGKETHLSSKMRGIVTGDQVANPKPDPEIFIKAFETIRGPFHTADVLVVEDSPSGVRAALAANMQVAWLKDPMYNVLSDDEFWSGFEDLRQVPIFSSHQDIHMQFSS